jgi:hypothetical protein
MVIHDTLLPAVQLQLLEAAVTAIVSLPLPEVNDFERGVTLKVHAANEAVADAAAFTAIEQVPVPEHPPPLQPEKIESLFGVAVNVTAVPAV